MSTKKKEINVEEINVKEINVEDDLNKDGFKKNVELSESEYASYIAQQRLKK